MKILMALLCLTAFGGLAHASELLIKGGMIKGNVPGSDTVVGYVDVENTSTRDIRIVGLKSNASEFTELHMHSMKGGRMRMRKLDSVTVKAGELVSFKSKGYHLMLINLNNRLKPDDKVEITLIYKDATEQVVELNVVDARKLYTQ